MRKFITTLILGTLLFHAADAQQYVKIKKDFTDKSIRFFKGEIYPVVEVTGDTKMFEVFDETYSVANDAAILDENLQNITEKKDAFIKLKDNNWLYVDVSSIATGIDTIWIAGTTTKLIPIVSNTTADLNPKTINIGEKFRLIIPNTVTIWYTKSDLQKYDPSSTSMIMLDEDEDEILGKEDNVSEKVEIKNNDEYLGKNWNFWITIA